ncbi:pitrilysin family protein [Methylophilaceae bacterium]|nr:pitrilysin family protein [Methylophilaceae bacterium]
MNFLKIVFLLCLLPIFAQADIAVKEITLKNGMRIIVKEDHRAPVVVSMVWYRAGSLDEVNGKTGVAHVLEHMMFKGTKTTKPGEYSRIVAAAGGRENAFTGADYTAYFQRLEKSKLSISMKMESDRMQNLVITEEEFNKEIKVVMEERRWRTDDKPKAQVNELFNSLIFRAHPYGKPIVGWMNDLENMTYKDAIEWYKMWYSPSNAILVVGGDVDTKKVFAQAKKYFEKIPAYQIAERKPQFEPKQNGLRRAILKAPGKLPYIQMGYPAPSLGKDGIKNKKEAFALDVLVGILSGTSSSRLNQNLVRKTSKAISVGAGYRMLSRGGQSTFEMYATPSEKVSVEDIEKYLKLELNKIVNDGVTDTELNRVITSVIAGEVYQKDSVYGAVMQIGQLETMGYSHQIVDEYIDNIKKVTSRDIQEVIKKYFHDDALTVVTLDPQPLDKNKKPKGRPHAH